MKFQKNKEKAPSKEQTDDSYTISAKEYALLDESKRSEWAPVKSKYERIPKICFVSFGFLDRKSVV